MSVQSEDNNEEILFTAKINGVEKPVTASQARRYAEQAGGLDEKLAQYKEYEGELRAWNDFKKGFQEDPHAALSELASAAGGKYVVPGLEDGSVDDSDPVSSLKQEIEQLKGQVYGFQAQTGLEREIGQLKSKYSDMTDEHLRQVLQTANQYNGLPLEAAYRLTRFDELEQKLKAPAEEAREVPDQPPISRGGSVPPGIMGNRSEVGDFKKPIKDLMAAAWSESRKKLNIDFS